MDFFQQQLDKNRGIFISVRELLSELQKASGASLSSIAKLILQQNLPPFYENGAIAGISGVAEEVTDERPGPLQSLLVDIVRDDAFPIITSLADGADSDRIGWYRVALLPELHKLGWPLGKLKGQAIDAFPVPEWFRPYVSRMYLTLDEASDIILRCTEGVFGSEAEMLAIYQNYKVMLREAAKEEQISLEPGGAWISHDEEYWRLSTNDVRKLCHRNGLNWPVPWDGEPEQPLSTEVSQLQDQVKQLQEQVRKYQARADELQKLQQENAALRTKCNELETYGRQREGVASNNAVEEKASPRMERSELRLIAALTDVILGENGHEKHPQFSTQSALIQHIAVRYDGYDGLSESTLNRKIPRARKLLEESR